MLDPLLISTIVLFSAIAIDLTVGEYPTRLHPTVWVGRIIGFFKPRLKDSSAKREYIKGTIFALMLVVTSFTVAHYILVYASLLDMLIATALAVLILKSTFAIRSMEEHAKAVIDAIVIDNDIITARQRLARIVGRDTSNLDDEHILSAVIESIGESIVDGINSPLFYYALYGVPLAFAYRVINTLDSMLAYRDPYHKHIGYASAKLDTIANYIPARITAIIIVIASLLLRLDWKNAFKVMLRDRHNTPSKNSGYPMSALAGALRIRLEKIGYYTLGDAYESISIKHYMLAVKVMKLSALLFILIVVIPLLLLRAFIVYG
jgi:adenosylcobinamide-phosphate synthase